VEIVTAFYRAVRDDDGVAVSALVERHFHEEAAVTWPESLPYGGTLRGRARLRKALAAAASGQGIGPSDLTVVALADGPVEVAVELRFQWRAAPDAMPVESGAVEWWSFDDDGAVLEIRAFYADTAALVDPRPRHDVSG
jgi:hypothetical protein